MSKRVVLRCYDCSKPVVGTVWRCEACRARVNAARKARAARGFCYQCSEPTERHRCQPCADKANARRRAAYAAYAARAQA